MTRTRRSPAQKQLKAVMEASLLSDDDLERYLDNMGIESSVLDEWLDVAVRETERCEVEWGRNPVGEAPQL